MPGSVGVAVAMRIGAEDTRARAVKGLAFGIMDSSRTAVSVATVRTAPCAPVDTVCVETRRSKTLKGGNARRMCDSWQSIASGACSTE